MQNCENLFEEKTEILYKSYYCFSPQGSRYTNLAIALADKGTVRRLIFVNPLCGLGGFLKKIKDLKSFVSLTHLFRGRSGKIIIHNYFSPVPFRGKWAIARKMHTIWEGWLSRRLIASIDANNGILIIQRPTKFALLLLKKANKEGIFTVFDWADLFEEFSTTAENRKKMQILCKRIASSADVVCCVSPPLLERALQINSHSFLLPNATLTDTIPDKVVMSRTRKERLEKPVVCYYGLMNPVKLDYLLINEVATRLPVCKFIMIGPCTPDSGSLEELSSDNIEFLGEMNKYQLHAYLLENVDVCFCPYRMDDKPNIACSPMKMYETLGLGLPFVATKSFDPIDAGGLIRLGSSADEVINAIEEEVEGDSLEKRKERIAYARFNTWQNRADSLLHFVLQK